MITLYHFKLKSTSHSILILSCLVYFVLFDATSVINMKCVLAILALFSSSALAVSNEELLTQFSGFKARFSKVYPSQEEEYRRFLIFTENVLEAERHNRGESSWTKGINMWSDLGQEEWEETYLTGYKRMVPGEVNSDIHTIEI